MGFNLGFKGLNSTAFLLDFNILLYCSSFHVEYYIKTRHEGNAMFRITFLAKTLHKTRYRELINEICTLFDKRYQKFQIPRILKSTNILFSRTQNVYFSDLGSSEWGLGGFNALILPLPMSL